MIKLQIAYKSGDHETKVFPTFESAYSVFKKHLNVSVYEMYIRKGSQLFCGYYQPMNKFNEYD